MMKKGKFTVPGVHHHLHSVVAYSERVLRLQGEVRRLERYVMDCNPLELAQSYSLSIDPLESISTQLESSCRLEFRSCQVACE